MLACEVHLETSTAENFWSNNFVLYLRSKMEQEDKDRLFQFINDDWDIFKVEWEVGGPDFGTVYCRLKI